MYLRIKEKQLVAEIPGVLATLLGVSRGYVQFKQGNEFGVSAFGHKFEVKYLTNSSPGTVAVMAKVAAPASSRRRVVPLLAVPFMSDPARKVCEASGLSWFDLSGNARIMTPRIRIIVDGRPNRFLGPGRKASIFAPKSARVVRFLLLNSDRSLKQREIARATDMTDGYVSRIVSRLEHEDYVLRESGGAISVKDPALLLEAWRADYRFDKHDLLPGHVAARSGDARARFVSEIFESERVEYAATGLAAAWEMTRYAGFRMATFYLAEPPTNELLEKLGFREDERGANLWLVLPNDPGVFHGAATVNGMRCVHPVQVYLDLKSHPERSQEAAESLHQDLLNKYLLKAF